MTIVKQVALAVATLGLILVLAVVSNALLDIYALRQAAQAAQAGSACVDAKGWVNWSWPNVPTLSPPCPPAASTEPAAKK